MNKLLRVKKTVVYALCSVLYALPAFGEARWLETAHNFGAFSEDDGKVECVFRLVNDSPEAVAINAARATCGCTVPSFSRQPIEAGDTALVHVSFNPTGRPGRFSKTVTVDLSDHQRQRLTISGVVIGASNTLRSRYPIEAGPLKLRGLQLPLGTVKKTGAKSAFFEVYNPSDRPVAPSWGSLPAYISVTAPSDTIGPGEQGTYTFVFNADRTPLYGIVTSTASLSVDGQKVADVDLVGIVEEDFSTLTPKQLAEAPEVSLSADRADFGRFSPAAGRLKREITITNRGRSPLKIRRVYTAAPGVEAAVGKTEIKPGGSTVVTIAVDPSKVTAPTFNAPVQIITNAPDSPLSVVRAVGLVD